MHTKYMDSILSWIGAIASIFGALFALWQSYNARKSASEAKHIYNSFIEKREIGELKELQIFHRKAISAIANYGPASIPSKLTGINHESDANIIQEYIIQVREYIKYFSKDKKNTAITYCDNITPILDKFAKSNSNDELRKYGTMLFNYISKFSHIIKDEIDKRDCNV